MKKFLIMVLVAAFVLGLGVPVGASLYHEAYKWNDVDQQWQVTAFAEFFSKGSTGGQYKWQSAGAAVPGSGTYLAPTQGAFGQPTIYNYAHVFPWIDWHINETELIWDIFKPGNYMSVAFVVSLRANCPVQIHLGGGTFTVPDYFDPETVGGQNGHIEKGSITKDNALEVLGDKVRQYSLLDQPNNWFSTPRKGSGNVAQTGEDVLEILFSWYQLLDHTLTLDDQTYPDLTQVPAKDSTDWKANCATVVIDDTNALHQGVMLDEGTYKNHVVFVEDILVQACDSEGKYLETFVVTISPDP